MIGAYFILMHGCGVIGDTSQPNLLAAFLVASGMLILFEVVSRILVPRKAA